MKAINQDAFKPAYCSKCGQRAELRKSHNGAYGYWCCGIRWVVVGSLMDIYNELIL